nr:uncharacterized protein LOC107396371 isoform X2 [Nothobranchius furzeri]
MCWPGGPMACSTWGQSRRSIRRSSGALWFLKIGPSRGFCGRTSRRGMKMMRMMKMMTWCVLYAWRKPQKNPTRLSSVTNVDKATIRCATTPSSTLPSSTLMTSGCAQNVNSPLYQRGAVHIRRFHLLKAFCIRSKRSSRSIWS